MYEDCGYEVQGDGLGGHDIGERMFFERYGHPDFENAVYENMREDSKGFN